MCAASQRGSRCWRKTLARYGQARPKRALCVEVGTKGRIISRTDSYRTSLTILEESNGAGDTQNVDVGQNRRTVTPHKGRFIGRCLPLRVIGGKEGGPGPT